MSEAPDVPIEFNGRHETISERMKSHATEKIARLARFKDWLTRIEVVAETVHENPEVEMVVHLRKGAPIVTKDRSTSFSATIDLLVDKAETLLRKQKEKLTDRKTGAAKPSLLGADERERPGPDDETYEDIVRKTMRK